MEPQVIELTTHHLTTDDGHVGLIVPLPSGFIYETQAGGTCCNHPAMEGVYWPMNWRTWEGEQESAMCDMGLLEYTDHSQAIVEYALNKWDLEGLFKAPTRAQVDEMLRPSFYYDSHRGLPVHYGEAWVPVMQRHRAEQGTMINGNTVPGYGGRCMILTYPNSD